MVLERKKSGTKCQIHAIAKKTFRNNLIEIVFAQITVKVLAQRVNQYSTIITV